MRRLIELNLTPGEALTEPQFEDFVRRAFARSPLTAGLVLFCTPRLMSILDQLGKDRIQFVADEHSYGFPTKQWVTAHGSLFLVKVGGIAGVKGLLTELAGVVH